MKKTHTKRGFEIIEFMDDYGAECSLQESSSAEESKIWLGCDNANPKMLNPDGHGWVPIEMPEDYIANTRMHLTRKQVKSLLPHLIRFAFLGRF